MDSDLKNIGTSTWLKLKRHFTESFSGELLSVQHLPKGDEWRDSNRSNAYRYISALITAVVLPLAVYNVYVKAFLPAIGTSIFLAFLLLDIVLLSRGRKALMSPFMEMLISITLLMLGLHSGQEFALFLLYPIMVAAPVLMRPRQVMMIASLAGIVLAPLLLSRYDILMTTLICVSLVLCWLITAWLMWAVTEQAHCLREMAITDPLTGAYNRRYLEQQAGKCLETWSCHQHQFSLLLLDIDHFKWINDKFGHAVGDSAIQELVGLINKRMRKIDVLCRYGGEEFVLLLSESDGEQAMKVANDIRKAVQRADILPEGKLTVSIGVCDVVLAENAEHWLKMADVAMYLAKLNGRNRVELAVSTPDSSRAANAENWSTPTDSESA